MKRFLSICFAALSFVASGSAQTINLYTNYGVVADNGPIDAFAFANYGIFSTASSIPFDFQNTRNFTNRGTMVGVPGFRFATASSGTPPFRTASNFVNEVGATVNATDFAGLFSLATGGIVPGIGTGASFAGQIVSPSFLLVSADTIVNHGFLIAGAAGLLQLNGQNVDLSRGGIGIGRVEDSPTHSFTATNFFPDPGIYDVYWGGETNENAFRVGSLLQITKTATNVASPIHQVTNALGFDTFTSIRLSNPISSVFTNVGGSDPTSGLPTNIQRQAAFVALRDTNLTATIKWAPSNIATNPFQTAIVEITLAETNTVTGDPQLSTLYFSDKLASWTNYNFLQNIVANPVTQMPASYDLSRNPPNEWLAASGGKGTLTNNFFYNASDTNYLALVTNFWAAYSARVDSLASQPPQVPQLDVRENPGRVEINAQNLNLNRTRIRGTGLVSIRTPNLMGATNLIVDAENVLFNLGLPSGPLKIQGVVSDKVIRLNGSLRAYSAVWTNYLGIPFTNSVPDPSGTGTTNIATNQLVEIGTHIFILDATGLQATKPVFTHDFNTTADELVLNDPMTVVRSFVTSARTFTLNNDLNLTGTIENWGSSNTPSLKTFNIGKSGSLTVPNVANLGADLNGGYDSFSNAGVVVANGIVLHANNFANLGAITSMVNGIVIETGSAQFQDSDTVSVGDIRLSASDVRLTSSTIVAGGALTLSATRSLSDSGAGASNEIFVVNGFNLPVKPAQGDLLGTTIASFAPRFGLIDHVWAGADRGASAAGFQDNVAIGHLILGGDRDVQLSFRGATGRNGMYVDFLELDGPLTNALAAGDLGSALAIDPSLTIYFADSNVSADELQQQSGGRLVKVDFAGPSGFVSVPTKGGNSVQMAQAVRDSTTVDSDGDGIANAYDAFPLDADEALRLTGARLGDSGTFVLTWVAQPNTKYQVEVSSDVHGANWQVLTTYSNNSSAPQAAVVPDQLKSDHVQRYYRVRTAAQ